MGRTVLSETLLIQDQHLAVLGEGSRRQVILCSFVSPPPIAFGFETPGADEGKPLPPT